MKQTKSVSSIRRKARKKGYVIRVARSGPAKGRCFIYDTQGGAVPVPGYPSGSGLTWQEVENWLRGWALIGKFMMVEDYEEDESPSNYH